MKPCMLHPENECKPDAEGKCACSPPGRSHKATCATTRGERCNCMVIHIGDAIDALTLLTLRRRTEP